MTPGTEGVFEKALSVLCTISDNNLRWRYEEQIWVKGGIML